MSASGLSVRYHGAARHLHVTLEFKRRESGLSQVVSLLTIGAGGTDFHVPSPTPYGEWLNQVATGIVDFDRSRVPPTCMRIKEFEILSV
jgi:hypothetical protein